MSRQPSGREMADIAVANGAIDMAQGVVHTPPPASFKSRLESLFSERKTHIYASPAGYLPYRKALLETLTKQRNNLTLDNIMATNGVTGGLVAALRSATQPGDAVALMEPFYPAHSWAIESLFLKPAYVPYDDDFSLNIETIIETLKQPDVKVFLLGNPANPTGTLTNSEYLKKIVAACEENNVLLLMDEVYRDFVWEGEFVSPLEFAESLDNLVIVRSFSKNLALAGWRCGYAITSETRLADMIHIHEAFYVGAPAPAQIVLAEILLDPTAGLQDFVKDITMQYRKNRTSIIEAFKSIGMEAQPNQGAYYMMIKHNKSNDVSVMKELLEQGIAVAPGVPFYRPGTESTGYLRAHFALSEDDCEKVVEILSR